MASQWLFNKPPCNFVSLYPMPATDGIAQCTATGRFSIPAARMRLRPSKELISKLKPGPKARETLSNIIARYSRPPQLILPCPETMAANPLKILSLDGGGIRGLSSLLILERVMEDIRDARGSDSIPRPCEVFDLIGGTSTGGIIAIMLGRLGMTVADCIQAYKEVAQQAFTPKKTFASMLPAPPSGAFSATALEKAIKETIAGSHLSREIRPRSDLLFRSSSCTKTAVTAITKDNVHARVTLLTTYDSSSSLDGCTIWQVARATSAATTFFKPIKIGRDEIEFIDAGICFNNPCEVLIEEAARVFAERSQHSQILSIGTGLGDVVTIDTRISIVKALKSLATSSRRVADRLGDRYGDSDDYCRLNVDQGLDDVTLSDWEKSSLIASHTHNYINAQRRAIKKFAGRLAGVSQGTAVVQPSPASEDIPAVAAAPAPVHHIPLKNHRFVEREAVARLRVMLFTKHECQNVALVGLGGVGKTQVALSLAHWVKAHEETYSVLWVHATSMEAFEQSCREIAGTMPIKKLNENEDAKTSLQRHLSLTTAGPWFLVVDNADDASVMFGSEADSGVSGVYDYLPQSERGLILFTTRHPEIASTVAGGDMIELQEMNTTEATKHLENALARQLFDLERASIPELLEKLNCLPLAITQAAAYLNEKKLPIVKYLQLLQDTEQHDSLAKLMSREFREVTPYKTKKAVTTTWITSFNMIRDSDSNAARLLEFIACIESKSIPQSILPVYGDEEAMEHAIGTLCGYAFLNRVGDTDTFGMHSLVQMATRLWLEANESSTALEDAAQHLAVIFPDKGWKNRELWRKYLPHASKLLRLCAESDASASLSYKMGQCLIEEGKLAEAIQRHESACRWYEQHRLLKDMVRNIAQDALVRAYLVNTDHDQALTLASRMVQSTSELPEGHLVRLQSKLALGKTHVDRGDAAQAIPLLESLVFYTSIFPEDHDIRLLPFQQLAKAYHINGDISKAIDMLESIVAIRRKTKTDNSFDELLLQEEELATAYQDCGRFESAVALFETIVEARAQLPEDHHRRRNSRHRLAKAYQANGQVGAAITIWMDLAAIEANVLDKQHPNYLHSDVFLAMAYNQDDQMQETIKLLEPIVADRARVFNDHTYLCIQQELGKAYLKIGCYNESIEIFKQVVETMSQSHKKDNIEHLGYQQALATAYLLSDQLDQAISLFEHVVETRGKIVAEDDPDQLLSQYNLGMAYLNNGQAERAIYFLERKVQAEAGLDDSDPARLLTQQQLACAYQEAGQIDKAIRLLEHVVTATTDADTLDEASLLRWLRIRSQLACTYQENGQYEEAIGVLGQMAAVDALQGLAELEAFRQIPEYQPALEHVRAGQSEEAFPLLEHVVTEAAASFSEDDPARLHAQFQLGCAYASRNQVEKAIVILEHVFAKFTAVAPEGSLIRSALKHSLDLCHKIRQRTPLGRNDTMTEAEPIDGEASAELVAEDLERVDQSATQPAESN